MPLRVVLPWLLAALPLAAPAPPPVDLHIVTASEFVYMARTRPARQDWWLRSNQHALLTGDRLTVVRDDLGLTWRIDTKAGTYTETPRSKPASVPAAAPPVDMHTAGYDWEPVFEWAVKPTGRRSTIAGRPCREFAASGQADYSDSTATFWGCTPISPASPSPNDVVLSQVRYESTMKMIRETAARHGGLWVLQIEETVEPAIAPTMVVRVKVDVLEEKPAPDGLFDLSPTLKKAGR